MLFVCLCGFQNIILALPPLPSYHIQSTTKKRRKNFFPLFFPLFFFLLILFLISPSSFLLSFHSVFFFCCLYTITTTYFFLFNFTTKLLLLPREKNVKKYFAFVILRFSLPYDLLCFFFFAYLSSTLFIFFAQCADDLAFHSKLCFFFWFFFIF